MKKYILNLVIIISATIFLNGCYTVLWMPEDDFPSEISTNEYYPELYYGDYYGFYDYPWWTNFAPPRTPVGEGYIRNENSTTSSIRNEGQGRGTDNGREIIRTNPPSKEASNNNNSDNTSSSSTGSSSSVNSSSSSSNTRSSNNSSVRNNNGNRNSNSGRK
jgi:hypothetical protein